MKKPAKILAFLLAAAMTVPVLAGCSGDEGGTTSGSEGTTAATTPAVTTQSKPPVQLDPTKGQSYVQTLDELMKKITSKYYNKRMHQLNGEPTGGQAVLWGFGAYLEALADWYALCPNSTEAKEAYVEALDNGLKKYRVSVGRLSTPAGSTPKVVYYNAGAGGSGDYYYDDNAWICYQLLNAYVQLGDKKYLTEAEELLKFFWTGWDDQLGGGIYWDKSFSGKNTCENGPIAICYLWAYLLTQKEEYLQKGKQVYDWTYATLCENGLYCDSIGLNGNKNTWKADYNQGTPLYAACLLYLITEDKDYLDQAKKTATQALGLAFSAKGRGDKLTVSMNNNPIYKSWCVGWLMRGFEMYVTVSGKAGNYFVFMEKVLDATLEQPMDNGYYDPYFLSKGWDSESRTDIVQPCGVASVIAACARYELVLLPLLNG